MAEILDRRLQTISGSLVDEIAAFEISFVGDWVHRLRVLQRRLFLFSYCDSDLIGDSASDAALKHQGVPPSKLWAHMCRSTVWKSPVARAMPSFMRASRGVASDHRPNISTLGPLCGHVGAEVNILDQDVGKLAQLSLAHCASVRIPPHPSR
jgi:hypothetical protein